MPLLDHFHPPMIDTHSWRAFHSRWAVAICDAFNAVLPASRFLAEVQVSVGPHIEAGIAEFELNRANTLTNGAAGGVAVQVDLEATYAETRQRCHL